MKKILVVAPHPDDETLGCGGLMLKAQELGDEVYWMIVTSMSVGIGYSLEAVASRKIEIEKAEVAYKIKGKIELGFPAGRLDIVPRNEIIGLMGKYINEIMPTEIFLPFRRDAHSDHEAVFDCGLAASKWFRHPSIKRILSYETQSETDFDIAPDSSGFRPNLFVNITDTLEKKIRIAKIFASEFQLHPFPRNIDSIRALATIRGSASGFNAAEAFMMLRSRED